MDGMLERMKRKLSVNPPFHMRFEEKLLGCLPKMIYLC